MDLLTLLHLAGYLFWPLLLIGFIYVFNNPKVAGQKLSAILQKIFRRAKNQQ